MGKYILFGVLTTLSAAAVILGLMRGSGKPRKRLLRSVLLLGGAALVCFGGEAVLAQFDMGWRCGPFNLMLFLCVVLFVVMVWRCLNVLSLLENTRSVLQTAGFISLTLVIGITLAYTAAYFCLLSWKDDLVPHNGQTIVYANDIHGGSGARRYFTHINSLVHGAEIEHDGLW